MDECAGSEYVPSNRRSGAVRPDPCAVIILGASGDLTRRKLVPALAGLGRDGFLPDRFCLLGTGRTRSSSSEFFQTIRAGIALHTEGDAVPPAVTDRLAGCTEYVSANLTDPDDLGRFSRALERLETAQGTGGNRLFYLSLPPSTYPATVSQLVQSGLLTRGAPDRGWHRVVVEKPFGTSLDSARLLNGHLRSFLNENQIFRIDHYLGKDTVQNLLILRFGNVIFEPLWDRRYVDHVQITVAEELGVEGRGAYYEEAGALRDMFQNHLLQLLCLVAMEPPVNFSADAVRDEKTKVLRAIRPWTLPEEVAQNSARGQYGPGTIGDRVVPSYRQERNVSPTSSRETYAACRFLVDNWRWQGVPFYLRSGKRMPGRLSEIFIQFRTVPHMMFKATDRADIGANSMAIRIQPNEGISITFEAKVPGVEFNLRPVRLDFSYQTAFKTPPPSAYQTLLLQALQGDATLFTRRDEAEAQWEIIDPILSAWESTRAPSFPNYDPGSWGPSRADELIQRDGREWHNP
ncbi:MAG: glucose-6-phosphate dehydrogenase [Candidatus Riflebacteria bacterium]|nr:glucose-6-phosphate dehydrogenase [Candidatus Riflebacteria bacterium]